MFKILKSEKLTTVLILIVSVVFISLFAMFTGNSNQIYNDIIAEYVSGKSLNKSAEMFLIYFLSLFGIFVYTIYFFVKSRINKDNDITPTYNFYKLPIILTLMVVLYQFLYVFKFSALLLGLFVFALVLYKKKYNDILKGLFVYILNFYAVIAIQKIMVFCTFSVELKSYVAVICSFILSSIILFINKNEKLVCRAVLIAQLLLPGLLFVYLTNRYLYNNKIYLINLTPLSQIIILLLILALFIEAFYLIRKNWNAEKSINDIISLGSCISVMGFNLFYFAGATVPDDFRHPYENIIGFHQIFQMGQIPFKEYIPVSGFYSTVHGALFQLFGNGQMSNYYNVENLYYLLIAVILVVLMKFHINKIGLFLISFLFWFPHPCVWSDRGIFILPIMLILSMPKLIENKNLWLKIWILTSLFHGLYYPVYGAAVAIAYLPLGIYQFITFIKSEEFKQQSKNFRFYFNWFLAILPVIAALPLLIGTYKHISVMGSQTILADGITRFGQYVDGFLGYYKSIILYILTFLVPAFFVWISFALAMKSFNNHTENLNKIKTFCLILSVVICPLIAFSYTFVRLDFQTLYARSSVVLIACVVMSVIFALKYGNTNIDKAKIISFAIILPILGSHFGFFNIDSNLKSFYSVSNDYIYSQNAPFKIGTGFIHKNTLRDFVYSKPPIQKEDYVYFGNTFFVYYIHDLKGLSVLESSTVNSFSAAKETIELLKKNKTFVYYINPIKNYYLYYWLMTCGKYIYIENKRLFVPTELIKNKKEHDNYVPQLYSTSNHSNSLGLSIKTLMPIFSSPNVTFKYEDENSGYIKVLFDKEQYGNDIDYLYLEFNNADKNYEYAMHSFKSVYYFKQNLLSKFFMKKYYNPEMNVRIDFEDDEGKQHAISANMGQGKLLIPLGMGTKWLLNNHSYIGISIEGTTEKNDVNPKIKTMKFLKLREVN